MRIPIQIYNRHIHLSASDCQKLFGKWYQLTHLKQLSQPWEFICQETLDIVWTQSQIPNINIIWPIRKNTQIEIYISDCDILWITPTIKSSWDLQNTPWTKIIWPHWSVFLQNWVIVPTKHLHCSVKEAQQLSIKNWQNIKIQTYWSHPTILENIKVRVKDHYVLDLPFHTQAVHKHP